MFISALATRVRLWNQTCCPSVEEWSIYTKEFYSAVQNKDIMKFRKADETGKYYVNRVTHSREDKAHLLSYVKVLTLNVYV